MTSRSTFLLALAAAFSRAVAAPEGAPEPSKVLEGIRQVPAWSGLVLVIAGCALVVVLLVSGLSVAGRRLRAVIARRAAEGRLPALRVQKAVLISSLRTGQALEGLVRLIVLSAQLVILYASLLMLFAQFETTRLWGRQIWSWTMSPLRSAVRGVVEFIPDLFHILVIVGLAHLFMRFLRRIASEIDAGNLRVPGFYADWAKPTLNIVRFIGYAFVLVVIFPYLPGSDSPVFKGVTVFLGLLISLGSSSAFANVIAGLVITYMRSFRLGDRVQVGEIVGDVVEKTLLVTRIKTVYNETVTLPNAALLAGNTVNYTSAALHEGLLLHASVTIGYDVPWRQVHAMLQAAAGRTEGVLAEPAPFVLQNSLDDFYVTYELNVAVREAHRMRFIYSDLRQNIQDTFFEAGVEIMSPHYRAGRDGTPPAIPREYSFRHPVNRPAEGDRPAG